MKLEQGHAKHNFSRRVYTQTAKLADTIILIHYCIASNKSKCFDSIPIIWRPLLEYILDSSRSNEFRYLFVARYSMENKNRKLPTRLKEYDCKFKMIDVNLFIKNSCQDLGTFREVQLIFESVFSSKKANRLWKHATSDGIKKDLRNYANDNLRRRNLLNSCKMNEIERVNEDIGEHEDDIGIAESENRLAERYRHNILFFDEMVETIISIDLSSYKACYEKNKIVNMELKDLFRLCDSQKFGNYEIIYDDITKIAKHSSEMLASTNSYNERTNQNLVSKHCFFQKDIKNSHLSQIGQIVLLFSRKLAVKLSLEVLGDQLEQREYYETLLNNNLVAFDIFPAGCIEQDPHWDFELPKDLLDDERFYGASVILNSTAINQELQIHMWDECEYDSACLTLTVFNRKPYSITLMDARLLHNEPINTRKHSIYHMSLYLSPLDSNNTPPRTALKFVSDIERRSGISIEYKICGENLTINKKRVKPGTLTDSIVLKNLRENLHTHLKDIEVDIIDQHIKSFVNNLEKTFIRK